MVCLGSSAPRDEQGDGRQAQTPRCAVTNARSVVSSVVDSPIRFDCRPRLATGLRPGYATIPTPAAEMLPTADPAGPPDLLRPDEPAIRAFP